MGEHVGRHVGKDDVTAGQLVAVREQVGVSQVVGHRFVPVVGLGDEQIAISGQINEDIGPCSVAGVSNGLACHIHT